MRIDARSAEQLEADLERVEVALRKHDYPEEAAKSLEAMLYGAKSLLSRGSLYLASRSYIWTGENTKSCGKQ